MRCSYERRGIVSHGSEMVQKAGPMNSAPRHMSVTIWLELVKTRCTGRSQHSPDVQVLLFCEKFSVW